MLGLAKSFVIILVLAIAIAVASKNWKNAVVIIILYAIVKIIWKFLTGKRK